MAVEIVPIIKKVVEYAVKMHKNEIARYRANDAMIEYEVATHILDAYKYGVMPNDYLGVWMYFHLKVAENWKFWRMFPSESYQIKMIDDVTNMLREEYQELYAKSPPPTNVDIGSYVSNAVSIAKNHHGDRDFMEKALDSRRVALIDEVPGTTSDNKVEPNTSITAASILGNTQTWLAIGAVVTMLLLSQLFNKSKK